jgi:hypothetical protein
MALVRMFGTTPQERTLEAGDVHVPHGKRLDELGPVSVAIEVRIALPEITTDPKSVAAVFNQMVVPAPNDGPFCRIRLEGKWSGGAADEGEMDSSLYWISTSDPTPKPEHIHRVTAVDRARIQVHYLRRSPKETHLRSREETHPAITQSIERLREDRHERGRRPARRTLVARDRSSRSRRGSGARAAETSGPIRSEVFLVRRRSGRRGETERAQGDGRTVAIDQDGEGTSAGEELGDQSIAVATIAAEGGVGVEEVDVLGQDGDARDVDGMGEQDEGGELGRVADGVGGERRRGLVADDARAGRRHVGPAAISGVRREGPSMRMV